MPRSRLVVVPARSGSKRIKNKNMIEIGGVPALHRTVALLVSSNLFAEVAISTDSPEILNSCSKFGLKRRKLRPAELASDHATVTEVLQYEAITRLHDGLYFDEIWHASCFSFMFTEDDLNQIAKRALSLNDNDLLLTVLKYPAPIQWALERKGESDSMIPLQMESLTSRSQDLRDYYYDSGNLAVFNSKVLYNQEPNLGKLNLTGFEIPPYKSVDVDTVDDLKLLEYIFKGSELKKDLQD